jgi:hypothetical protein
MSRSAGSIWLSVLSVALACGVAVSPVRAADHGIADPEQGAVIGGAYVNPYFGLRYPLPPGWKAGPQPPRPSAGGYYVLSTPAPPPDAEATILIAAQDTFFAAPPIANVSEVTRNLVRNISASGGSASTIPGAITIAGHQFVETDLPGTPLSRIIFATDIRCHVVIFSFAGVQPGRLQQLATSVLRLSVIQSPPSPDCIPNYATARTILQKVEPVATGPQFVKVPVRIIIGADGRAKHIHVLRAVAGQQRNIEDALIQWRFAPYRGSGKAAEVETGLTFDFKPNGTPD